MNKTNDLVYSDNLCSAYLSAIVKAFEAHHPNTYLGRTAIQKLTYFTKVLGAPIPCSFGIYTYGPYSDKVTFAVESLLADDVIEDQSTNPKYSNYKSARNSEAILSEFADKLRPYEDHINRAVKALGAFPPKDLELIATLHFIAKRLAEVTRIKPSKTAVRHEFKLIKQDKFNDTEINNWYDALVQAGLIEAAEHG